MSKKKLFAFASHGTPTLFGTGTEIDARQLCGIMNAGRAINPVTVQPVSETEIGIDEPFDIAAEIKRSAVIEAARRSLIEHRQVRESQP
jgi:hypothetical protein